jgi:hypothetical protein
MLTTNLTMIHLKMMSIPLPSQVSVTGIHHAETLVHNNKQHAPKSPANDDEAAPRTKGVFFCDFPVSIEPLPSRKHGAALSNTSKCSPLGKARSSDPCAGSGGNDGGGGGSGGSGDDESP